MQTDTIEEQATIIITNHNHIDTESIPEAIERVCADDISMRLISLRYNISKGTDDASILLVLSKALASVLLISHEKIVDVLTHNNRTLSVVRNAIVHHTKEFFVEYGNLLLGNRESTKNAIISDDHITVGYTITERRIDQSIAQKFLSIGNNKEDDQSISTSGITVISRGGRIKELISSSVFKRVYEGLSPRQFVLFREIISANKTINQLVGTVGSGKSTLCCVLFCYYLEQLYEQAVSGDTILKPTIYAIGKTLRHLHNTFVSTLCKTFGIKQPHIRSTFIDIGPMTIQLVSLDTAMSIDTIRGSNASLIIVEESSTTLRHSDYQQIISRLRSDVGTFQPKLLMSSNFSNKKSVAYTVHSHTGDESSSVYSAILNTKDNPYIKSTFQEMISAGIPKDSLLYKLHIEGSFVNSEEYSSVYRLDEDKNLMDRDRMIPLHGDVFISNIIISCDDGCVNPLVYLVLQNIEFSDGRESIVQVLEYLYYEKFHCKNTTREQYENDLMELISKYLACNVNIDLVFPHDAIEKYYFWKTKLLSYHRIHVYKAAPKDVMLGIKRVSELLSTGRLFINQMLHHMIEEFYLYSYKTSERGGDLDDISVCEDKVLKQDDHCLDALRYGISHIGI